MLDLESLTPEQIAALTEELTGGSAEVELMERSAGVLRGFAVGFERRLCCVLMGRLKIYGQDVTACDVTPLEDHSTDDVAVVQTTRITARRKWYRSPSSGPPSWTLYSELTWETTRSTAPTGPRLKLEEGGGEITLTDCVPTIEGDTPPANWDGYEEEGYMFSFEDLESTREDVDTITGATMAAAATAGEVLLSDSGWVEYKRFGRRWGLEADVFSLSALLTGGGCRRFELELKAVGCLLPFKLKWTATDSITGAYDDSHEFSPSAWTWTLASGYPTYKHTVYFADARIIPAF